MKYVLVAKFKHKEDADDYCKDAGFGCFVCELSDGSFGVYEPLK